MEDQAYEPTMIHNHYQKSIRKSYGLQNFQVIEFINQLWQL
jgi:hypothetical protein